MAHFSPANSSSRFGAAAAGAKHQVVGGGNFSDDDDDDDSLSQQQHDRIRRSNYLSSQQHQASHQQQQQQHQLNQQASNFNSTTRQETIHVKLNESYFANEKKALVNMLANCRQKLNTLQMFNPAKNQSLREQQEQQWNDNVSLLLYNSSLFAQHHS